MKLLYLLLRYLVSAPKESETNAVPKSNPKASLA